VSFVLDSTVIIDFVIGYPPGAQIVEQLFAQHEPLYVCDVVTCESLSKGAADEVRVARNLLRALEYVALAPDDAQWAGDRRRTDIDSGRRKPSTTDALIAAVAHSLGATVVTRNARDFEGFDIPVLGYGKTLPPAG
jgi:predicted nucleic acid-binding protein